MFLFVKFLALYYSEYDWLGGIPRRFVEVGEVRGSCIRIGGGNIGRLLTWRLDNNLQVCTQRRVGEHFAQSNGRRW